CQAAIGFTQYFTGVPSVLVVVHVFGAMLVVVATAGLWVSTRSRGDVPTVEPVHHAQFATASP
ncbi:oxidase assembly protein, partial [Kibdelosporangium lantanae]